MKFIVTEINKLLGRNYNLIGFNALSAEDLLQVTAVLLLLHVYFLCFSLNSTIFFLADIMQRFNEDTTAR